IPLLVLALVLVVLDRRATTPNGTRNSSRPRFLTVVAVLAIIAALACGVQVYRVGDSGARAAWGNRIATR
ncbi:MAG: hypothetical protein QOH68_4158, partial [Nocardioidaceae bacterium]|nr:hypothetical protein [Nocardioidaceae bacterium]